MFAKKTPLLCLLCFTLLFSCKKWDQHNEVTETALNENLMEQISKHPELSKFSEYLVKTGLDKEISSSKTYSVWAPENTALSALAPDVVNDVVKLKAFLLNHISGQLFFTRMAQDSIRVPLLNGKKGFFYRKRFEDANITTADIYVRNGALHVIDKIVPPLQNAWEWLVATKDLYTQNGFIAALNYDIQDTTLAQLDSINPLTGLPVYKPNTGIVRINTFRKNVYDLSNEDSLYTYVVFANTAYPGEITRQLPYFKSAVANLPAANAAWNVVKDMAIKGLYLPNQLAAPLLSKFNVRVPVKSSAIIATVKLSNGIAYIVNEAITALEEKIPAITIQGEKPDGFKAYDDKYMTKIFYRQRYNPRTGAAFNDIYASLGSIGATYYIEYRTDLLYAARYKVYWVALNDKTLSGQGDDPYGTDSTLQQILQIGSNDSAVYNPTFSVQAGVKPYTYDSTYLGDYVNGSYDFGLYAPRTTPTGTAIRYTSATRRIRLLSPTSLTGIPYNLTLDYLRFVPVP